MAPEQERGEHVDQLCSLCKVAPHDAHKRHRLLRQARIDEDLIVIIDKALDPDPGRRYPHAGGMAADLKAFKPGAWISARSYSLLGMLVHWTRRHRALAASLVGAIAIAIGVTLLYVHNVSAERDRADAARAEAEHERRMAAMERDRAQLSEATMMLEKDPLRSVTRSPTSRPTRSARCHRCKLG